MVPPKLEFLMMDFAIPSDSSHPISRSLARRRDRQKAVNYRERSPFVPRGAASSSHMPPLFKGDVPTSRNLLQNWS